jgi:class 3 adenylate cyclase
VRGISYTTRPPHLAFVDFDGPGDTPMVYIPGTFLPIALMEQDPGCARFLSGLCSFSRLIAFDRSGLAYSDPIADWNAPVVQTWSTDVERILDHLDVARCTIFASGFAAGSAVHFAVAAPDRVDRMIIFNFARSAPDGLIDAAMRMIGPDVPEGGYVDWPLVLAPSRATDPSFVDWWFRTGQQAASPTVARRIWRSVMTSDLTEVLRRVQVPALLIHRSDNTLIPEGAMDEAAALMPAASVVELPGDDLLEFAGDIDALIAEIATFCTGSPARIPPSRGLVTLLLTDIVSSTELAARARAGDWRGVLDRHDELARREVGRYGGAIVKHAGDGLLSTFDSPSRALRAAVAVRDALTELDVHVRCGVHLGEVDQRGDDVAGVNVHVVARVTGVAGAGEILCSSALPIVVSGGAAEFESAGRHDLKGLDGAWELYRLLRPPT